MTTTWFNTDSQQALYSATTERTLLIVKQAQAKRMAAEQAKVDAKYDGSAGKEIEDQANALGDERSQLATWLGSVNSALDEFNNVREYLLQAEGTLSQATPSAEAFNTYYDALNSLLYNEKWDSSSLISNPSNHRGSWSETTTTVDANNMSADISHHYLGNDFAITLDDGTYMEPNLQGALSGSGASINRANLKLVSRDSSDHVVFQDVTDPANPVTYSGTVKRGGLGVLPAWLYGDLSDPTVKAEAKGDFKAAYKKLARYELDFNTDQAVLSGIDSRLASKIDDLQAQYEKVAGAEVDAKLAEKKAIKARFDLFNNTLALTSGQSSNFISQMFTTKTAASQKKTLTDVLLGTVTG